MVLRFWWTWLVCLALLISSSVPLDVEFFQHLTGFSFCQASHLVLVHGAQAGHPENRLCLLSDLEVLVDTTAEDFRVSFGDL